MGSGTYNMKLLAIQSKVNPDFVGYGDYGYLIDNYQAGVFSNGIVSASASIIWRGTLSCQPNPNMFGILKDGFIKRDADNRILWKPMTEMTTINRSWCAKCTRSYCENWLNISSNQDARIDCKLYARLACTAPGTKWESYIGRFQQAHPKFGTCILLENAAKLPSRQPDSEHNGEYWCKEIFVHRGSKSNWEGSAGCITIPPDMSDIFFAHFFEEELVRIEIFDWEKKMMEEHNNVG
jgi:hypothetical protein